MKYIIMLMLCSCTSADCANGQKEDCATNCRELNMELVYIETGPYPASGVLSCTCAVKEQE